jgi:hypothetical protein
MSEEKYDIKIIKRHFQCSGDDHHATVTRRSDGVELIWISKFRWLLKIYVRRKALDKWFSRYDQRKKELAEVEEISR